MMMMMMMIRRRRRSKTKTALLLPWINFKQRSSKAPNRRRRAARVCVRAIDYYYCDAFFFISLF